MRSIWKYPIPIQGRIVIEMPVGAEILTVQRQGSGAQIWALVNEGAKEEYRHFRLYGTGHIVREGRQDHVGTFQLENLVWHLFEVNE